jgi:hypothetical protein
MSASLIERLQSARVYDLEQPRFAGMPIHPSHRPGYFYALHRRHRDTLQPEKHGPRSSASGTLTMMEHSGEVTTWFVIPRRPGGTTSQQLRRLCGGRGCPAVRRSAG